MVQTSSFFHMETEIEQRVSVSGAGPDLENLYIHDRDPAPTCNSSKQLDD